MASRPSTDDIRSACVEGGDAELVSDNTITFPLSSNTSRDAPLDIECALAMCPGVPSTEDICCEGAVAEPVSSPETGLGGSRLS
jgi:hypothetical protein